MTGKFNGWTIVFDLDGTLVNTAPDLLRALNHVLEQIALNPVDLDTIATMIGEGAKAMIRKGVASQGAALTEDAVETHFQAFLAYYADNIAVGSHPFEGAVAALDHLRDEGAVLAVCTNKTQALSDRLLAALGIADRFKCVVGADSVPQRKPNGDHILLTINAAGGIPARAIMVGDSRTDERAARNAGLPFVFVPFGYEAETVDQIGADAVVYHYSELSSVLSDLVS